MWKTKPCAAGWRLVSGVGEDATRIFGEGTFDMILCHGVLILPGEPDPLTEALSAIARPGAVISILTKNAAALAMRPALEGNYKEALTAFDTKRETNRLGLDTSTKTIPELSAKAREARHRAGAVVRSPGLHRPPGRPPSRPEPTGCSGKPSGRQEEETRIGKSRGWFIWWVEKWLGSCPGVYTFRARMMR